jgi:hypothetical protein
VPTLTEMTSTLLSNGAPAEPTKPAALRDHRHFEFWTVLDPRKCNFELCCYVIEGRIRQGAVVVWLKITYILGGI